jgi:rhodanese-related sulfurtransferase
MMTFRPGSFRLRVMVWALLGVCSALVLGGCNTAVTDQDIKDIPLVTLRKMLEDKKPGRWALIDARSPSDFAREHLPDAQNRPLDTFSGRKGDIDPALAMNATIVVYGDDPGSATAKGVVKRMLTSGYEEVYMYMGGLEEWRRSGLATVKGKVEPEAPAAAPAKPSTGGRSLRPATKP